MVRRAAIRDSPQCATSRAAGFGSRAAVSCRAEAATARAAGRCRSAGCDSGRRRHVPRRSTTGSRFRRCWEIAARRHRPAAPARCGNHRRETRSPAADRSRSDSASATSYAGAAPAAFSELQEPVRHLADRRQWPRVPAQRQRCSSFAGSSCGAHSPDRVRMCPRSARGPPSSRSR